MTNIIDITLSHSHILAHEPSTVWADIAVTAPEAQRTDRPSVDLVFLIDCSGSMGRGPGSPLDYACAAARYAIGQLSSEDRAAIIGYGDDARVIHPLSSDHEAGISAAAGLGWLGYTNISAGLEAAAAQLSAVESERGRIFLLSDGKANRGTVDADGIADLARTLKERHSVSLSTFGVGASFNEDLMEAVAVAGGGGYYFIENPSTIPAVFAEELAEVFAVSLSETRLSWVPSNGVRVGERLGVDSGAGGAYLGNIPAGATRRVLLELTVDGLSRGRSLLDVSFEAVSVEGEAIAHALSASVSVTANEAKVAEGVRGEVLTRVVEMQTAAAQAHAAIEAGRGNFAGAQAMVAGARTRMSSYLSTNSDAAPMLAAQAAGLASSEEDLSNWGSFSEKRMKLRSYRTRNSVDR